MLSMETQYDYLKQWVNERAETLNKPLPSTNPAQVVQSLDILSDTKDGKIPLAELEEVLPSESLDYLREKGSVDNAGNLEYQKFNPYPEENIPRKVFFSFKLEISKKKKIFSQNIF